MPQRRKVVEEDTGSLDSLMDALTNVVAVLIFVLLLVNCEVSQKVVQMMEDLVPASPEEIQRLKDMLKQLEIDKKKLEELKKLPPPPKVDLDSINQKISALQTLVQNKFEQAWLISELGVAAVVVLGYVRLVRLKGLSIFVNFLKFGTFFSKN